MKRLLYILLCLPLWLACTDEHIPTSQYEVEEGTPVKLRMSVTLPGMNVASRAFAEDIIDFPSLWVVAFDAQGYLVEWAKAKKLERVTDGTQHETQFSVELGATSETRILHFIANYADEMELEYGHESNVIGSLDVSGNQDVYWHRKVLSEGINDTETYVASNFRRIPLLRNFAKITVGVDSSVKNFTLTGFYVLNVPNKGTVAPYNGSFVDYGYNDETKLTKTYTVLNKEDYFGTMPKDVQYGQKTAPATWLAANGTFYMYENTYREVADETTSILIKGKFNNSDPETYYRADLVSTDVSTGFAEYYHILRNFEYHLNITGVVAAGKETPDEAIKAAANNNLSGSVDVKNLSNISNGTAKLEVSYTDIVLVSTDAITLKYRFLTNVANASSEANDRIKITPTVENATTGSDVTINGNVISKYKVATEDETVTINGTDTKWRVITITPVSTLPAATQEQTIRLYDTETQLYRDVKFTLRPKLAMKVNCTPIVPATAGSPVMVNICIPNGLNENLFPLEFAIESNTSAQSNTLKQYISPVNTEVMSVSTGNSIVPNHTNEKSYQYIKELTYENYLQLGVINGQRVFPVNFITNIPASASTVYVSNQYFNQGNDSFINTGTAHVASSEFTGGAYYGTGHNVSLSVTGGATGTAIITTNLNPSTVENVSLTSSSSYTGSFTTDTWSDRTMGVVTVGDYEYYLSAGPVRNILKMIVTSAKLDETDLEATTTMRVYRDAQSAKEFAETQIMTEVLSSFAADKNKTYEVDNLKADDKFWFAYMDAEGYIYYTSAEAKDLVAGAELIFKSEDKTVIPAHMTLTFGGGQNIYGSNQPVTLIFRTDKPGTYTLSSENLNIDSAESRVVSLVGTTLTVESNDINKDVTITCTTKYASDALTATVTESGVDNNSVTVTGNERQGSQLSNPALSATSAYYGEGHEVTLTFDVSAPCKVSITLNSGLSYTGSADLSNYECTSAGTQTIKLTSVGWNTAEKATITLVAGGEDHSIDANGATRNQLPIKVTKTNSGRPYDYTNVTMSYNDTQTEHQWSYWTSGTIITVDGLLSTTAFEFSYTRYGTTYTASTSAGTLAIGTVSLTFE